MSDSVPMTVAGHQALKEELQNLKAVERPKVVADIEEARAHGDISENAEYHAAKERQGFIESRIRELEGKLARAQVIAAIACFTIMGKLTDGLLGAITSPLLRWQDAFQSGR